MKELDNRRRLRGTTTPVGIAAPRTRPSMGRFRPYAHGVQPTSPRGADETLRPGAADPKSGALHSLNDFCLFGGLLFSDAINC